MAKDKDDKWIQKATKGMRTDKPCTGKKFGSKTCPPGKKMARTKAADGGSMSHVSGYSPVLGNNQFGYPSGGVPVQSGGRATHGYGRAFMKGGKV